MLSEPLWGPVGKEVYERTYRRIKEDGEPESWKETVERVVRGNTALVDDRFIEPGERDKLIELIYNFKVIPAGRHLWVSGVPGRQFLFNCHRAGFTERLSDHYAFTFDQLMQGGGVGANYSNRYIDQYRAVQRVINLHIVCDPNHPDYDEIRDHLSEKYSYNWDGASPVEDSREGWVNALVDVIDAHMYDGKNIKVDNELDLVLDVSPIRERGRRIRGFGGVASGPTALALMLHSVNNLFNNRLNNKLSSIDHMLIDHEIATCVVAGNVRRSARMSIKSWRDIDILDFIESKKGAQGHWSTNISVEIDDDFFKAYKRKKDPLYAHAVMVYERVVEGMLVNGEPGFYNISLASEGEFGDVGSTNPCGEIALEPWENCFSGDTKFLTKEYGSVSFEEVEDKEVTVMTPDGWKPATVKYFGIQGLNRVTFAPARKSTGTGYQLSRSSFRTDVEVTPTHRWELVNGTITTDLAVGDVVRANAANTEYNKRFEDGVRHGIMFGDGSMDRVYEDGSFRMRARLFGAKAEIMEKYFDHLTYPDSTGGAPEAWVKSRTNLKLLPSGDEGSDYLAGFVHGWCLADASERPNGSMHLASGHKDAEKWLREHAASAGWILRGVGDMPAETNFGERKSPLKMFTLAPSDSELYWRVVRIERIAEAAPVYCAVVPGAERFTLANGVHTMNCNLGHVNLDAFAGDFEGAQEAFRLMTRFLIRATYGDIPSTLQRQVVDRNRRIGVGFFGFQGWLVKNGIRYSDSHRNRYVRKTLKDWKAIVDKEKARYAHQLRIPNPIKGTTVAPTGSVAKLPGATEGLQSIYARYFIRRIRYSADDPKLVEFAEQGYEIEDDIQTANTKIVKFYCKDFLMDSGVDEDLVESQDEISLADSLAVQAMVQECWADNAISYTINVPSTGTLEVKNPWTGKIEDQPVALGRLDEALATIIHYLPNVKGTTIMVDGSRPQAPFERISKSEYELAEYIKSVGNGYDDCATGACPIK